MTSIKNIKKTGQLTALISFIIGTCILLLFLLSRPNRDMLITIGMYYVLIAFIINVLVFAYVFISALYFWDYRFKLFQTCGILLLNIPIAFGYFILVLHL